MKVTVKTKKSTYVLDKESMTWTRTETSDRSGLLPSETGKIGRWPILNVGFPLVVTGPAPDDKALFTSVIITVE